MLKRNNSSFTLIELLVVLALVAILSVVVILTLNPAELIKQARDSNRLSDLSTINTALNLFSSDVVNGFMGTSTVVYVSIPDSSATCTNLGLPSLPSGYTYNCVTSSNLRNTNGTGWIPVNFERISSNSPISQLPIDPTNTTTTRLYYTYTPGGSWELNATVEASKNKLGGSGDLTSKDGGSAPSQYEIGNNLNLNPLETGDTSLVGYWDFEEGTSATSTDRSGYGNHGTWSGTSAHYSVDSRGGNYAGNFGGTPAFDYFAVADNASIDPIGSISFFLWFKLSPLTGDFISKGGNSGYRFRIRGTDTGVLSFFDRGGTNGVGTTYGVSTSTQVWHSAAGVGDSSGIRIYVDGILAGSGSVPYAAPDLSEILYIGVYAPGSAPYYGLMDEVRIYGRALSAAEVLAIHNATK